VTAAAPGGSLLPCPVCRVDALATRALGTLTSEAVTRSGPPSSIVFLLGAVASREIDRLADVDAWDASLCAAHAGLVPELAAVVAEWFAARGGEAP
jgi:hypothetical protein